MLNIFVPIFILFFFLATVLDLKAITRDEETRQLPVATTGSVAGTRCVQAFVASEFTAAHRVCLNQARQGVVLAQLVTGLLYAYGEGTDKSRHRARLWLEEAARNGSAEARDALEKFNMVD